MGNLCCGEPIDFDADVELRHFELLRSVGKGAFGKVRIIQKKNDKKIYALKYINKMKCIKMKAVNNVIQERRLLEEIDHPFIVNLRYAFQDDENLFMVLDLMLGGDIRFHLDRSGPMREEVVRFYAAEIALGLNYLHKKRIVHRDLKPDNVLLDEDGHAHLTDLNIAVKYKEGTALKSVAGSMAYMAPEVLAKKGYYTSPDWWSLGVVLYELLFGKRPFRGKTNESLTQSVLSDTVIFPTHAETSVSRECLDFVRKLLERDLSQRLGNGEQNWKALKEHKFFTMSINGHAGIDWDNIGSKKCKVPFVPDAKRANFDASHELEELLLEENPLRVKKRSGKKDYSKLPGGETGDMAKDLMIMERKFTNYNFERRNDPKPSPAPTRIANLTAPATVGAETSPGADATSGVQHVISMHDLGNVIPEKKLDASETEKSPDKVSM